MRPVPQSFLRVLGLAVLVTSLGMLGGGCSDTKSEAEEQPVAQEVSYSEDGSLAHTVDAAGRLTRYSHVQGEDGSQTLTRELPDGSKVVLEADRFGRRKHMTDAAGKVRYEHDGLNRTTAIQREGAPPLKYAYQGSGLIQSIQVGDKTIGKFQYDFRSRLSVIDSPAGEIKFSYSTEKDGLSLVVCQLPNGVRTEHRTDPEGRVHSIAHFGADGQPLARFSYDYRADGLMRHVHEWWPTGEEEITYEYDNVARLAAVLDKRRGNTFYHYDLVGNRITTLSPEQAVGSVFDWAGRLVRHRDQPCGHDRAGNLTGWQNSAGTIRCTYTADNAIATVENPQKISYVHDGNGQLLSRTVDSSRTTFVVDPRLGFWRPLLATDENGRQTAFVWHGHAPLLAASPTGAEFFLTDHLGSVRAVADEKGAAVRRLDYDAFGVPRQAIPSLQPAFAGLFYDPQASLYLAKARAYDPELGRFLQRDPIHHVPRGSQKDLCAYVYCGNDPVNFLDVDGAESVEARWLNGMIDRIEKEAERETEICAQLYLKGNLAEKVMFGVAGSIVGSFTNIRGMAAWFSLPMFGVALGEFGLVAGAEGAVKYLAEAWFWSGFAFNVAVAADPWNSYEDSVEAMNDVLIDAWLKGVGQWGPKGPVYGADSDKAFKVLANIAQKAGAGTSSVRDAFNLVMPWVNQSQGNSPQPAAPNPPPVPANTPILNLLRGGNNNGPAADNARIIYDDNAPKARAFLQKGRQAPAKGKGGAGLVFNENARKGNVGAKANVGGKGNVAVGAKVGNNNPRVGNQGGNLAKGVAKNAGANNGPAFSKRIVYNDNAPKMRTPPNRPQRVGGVRLRGAGNALQLGDLKGIAIDDNGRLVLLSSTDGPVQMPPLRLDDVVTVFRCVYERGDAPSVSIDPDPKNLDGDTHSVRHGPGTEDTYVGWVLFECDRIMKSYGLGKDTVTGQPIRSAVPGYLSDPERLLKLPYDKERSRTWHRAWIVPKEVVRKRSDTGKLTLLDVPLKVNTERQVVREGKLVDAPDLGPTPEARGFADWFTKHYDKIAEENYVQPPPESGIDRPVPVFHELRRIALIVAVAENLREQGQPMPAWMREYSVRPCPVTKKTPAPRVTLKKTFDGTTRTASSRGGVTLAPPDSVRKTVAKSPAAQALAPVVAQAVAAAPSLQPVVVEHRGERLRAVALPGNDSLELGGLDLQEDDLAVPMGGGDYLRLVRYYSSFFEPSDCLGKGWTLDLPQMDLVRRTTERDGKTTMYRRVQRVTTALNRVHAEFGSIEMVPEVGSKLAVPDQPGPMLGLTGWGTDPRIGVPTERLIFRDGSRWHFDEAHRLLAFETAPLLRVFRRDARGRLERIEGYRGDVRCADIRLEYDIAGRLATATGSDKSQVRYQYGPAGTLSSVTRPAGTIGYEYQGTMLTAMIEEGAKVRQYEYLEGGQLKSERGPEGDHVTYGIRHVPDGVEITTTPTDEPDEKETSVFDPAGRLKSRRWGDGTFLKCERDQAGNTDAILTLPDGTPYRLRTSADGKHETVELPTGGKLQTQFDGAGRPNVVLADNTELLRLKYLKDGRLASLTGGNFVVEPQYRSDGVLTGSRLSAPDRPREWLETFVDDKGRTTKIADSEGNVVEFRYGSKGQLESLASAVGEMKIARDDKGRVLSLTTPWQMRWENTFDSSGRLQKREARRGTEVQTVEFTEGRPTRINQFDAGETRIGYEAVPEKGSRVRRVTTANGLELTYEYDEADRLAAVTCGSIYRLEYQYDSAGRLLRWTQKPVKAEVNPRNRGLWE